MIVFVKPTRLEKALAGAIPLARVTVAIVWVFAAALVTACTNTYVDHPRVTVAESPDFKNLRDTVIKYEDLRINQVQDTRNTEATYRQALTALTFGALAGGGVAALYGAHRDAVLGFGLAGTGSYALSNLFWSPERGKNLNDGNAALQCVTQTGAEVVAADASFAVSKKRIDQLVPDIVSCPGKPETDAVAAADRALNNLEAFHALDGSFASQLDGAASTIIRALNDRLEKFEATPAAAVRAGQAVSQFATGFVSQTTPPQVRQRSAPPRCLRKNGLLVAQELQNLSKRLEATMAANTNKIAALSRRCVFKGEGLQTLTATPTKFNIAKDVTIPITVTGAFGMPSLRWIDGPPPGNKLQANTVTPDRILIEGKSALSQGAPIEAEIIDQRPVPTPIRITIQPTG